jgi:hypothetical protein
MDSSCAETCLETARNEVFVVQPIAFGVTVTAVVAFAIAVAFAAAVVFLVCHSRRESAFALALAVACFSPSS